MKCIDAIDKIEYFNCDLIHPFPTRLKIFFLTTIEKNEDATVSEALAKFKDFSLEALCREIRVMGLLTFDNNLLSYSDNIEISACIFFILKSLLTSDGHHDSSDQLNLGLCQLLKGINKSDFSSESKHRLKKFMENRDVIEEIKSLIKIMV